MWRLAVFISLALIIVALKVEARPPPALPTIIKVGDTFNCTASWYGSGFYGHPTSAGPIYTGRFSTGAALLVPLGTLLAITNRDTGQTAWLLINDHGPYVPGRCLDLSTQMANDLGVRRPGTVEVSVHVLSLPQAGIQDTGHDDYVHMCAPCHGLYGHDGEKFAGVKIPDITTLRLEYGHFPATDVYAIIDGRNRMMYRGPHSLEIMPQFHLAFKEAGFSDDETQARIGSLVQYVASLQGNHNEIQGTPDLHGHRPVARHHHRRFGTRHPKQGD